MFVDTIGRFVLSPDFLTEFASSVSSKKESLKAKILKGKPNPLSDDFQQHFESIWVPLKESGKYSVDAGALEIVAIDSSVYTNLMSTGGIFYVIRSLAACRAGERRLLETDVFFTKANLLESKRFLSKKMEMLEFQVAIDAIKHGLDCSTILVDGSLYGRASTLPIETQVEDDRLMSLHYLRYYRELLDLCRNKGILLVGVSKESRSTFYRDYLLRLIFNETLDSVGASVDSGDWQRLKSLFTEMLDDEVSAITKFDSLRQKYGTKLDKIGLILDELRSLRPDYQCIMSFAETPGYTRPLLLGPSEKLAQQLQQSLKDPARYIHSHFPISVREKGLGFLEWGSTLLSGFTDFPAFISLYLLLDVRDAPIRIDIPYWNHAFVRAGWPRLIDINLDEVLKVMVSGYCGLDCYNLWLKNVDEKVRLRKSVVDNLYFPLMEQQLNAKIIRGRRYRRVKFP